MQKTINSKIIKFAKLSLLITLSVTQGLFANNQKETKTVQPTAQQKTAVKETPAEFKTKAWTENAEILNMAMELNPEGSQGIEAMFTSRSQAMRALMNNQTRTPEEQATPINERLHALVEPVKAFLPQVKMFKGIVKPLIEISLNRAYTEAENEKFSTHAEPLSFNTSIFSKFLNAQEDIDTFMKKTVTTDAEYIILCKEFQRVFSDLLGHAFPSLTKEYMRIEREKQQAVAQNNTTQTTAAPAA